MNDRVLIDTGRDNKNITKDVISMTSDVYYHYITFAGKEPLRYRKSRLLCLSVLKTVSPKDVFIYQGRQPLEFDEALLLSDNSNNKEYLLIIYKSQESFYPKERLCLDFTNNNHDDVFEYFKKIASIAGGLKGEDTEDTINILIGQFEKILKVNPRTVLSTYLGRKDNKVYHSISEPIFPFSYNISQKNAVENALNKHMSIIQGPPGTGKTQTILNIAANLIMSGKSVAIVSNNNSAIKNVDDKFKANGLGFFSAFLGNKTNKNVFFENQPDTAPDISDMLLDDSEFNKLKKNLANDSKKLNKLLDVKTLLAKLQDELAALNTEEYYFREDKEPAGSLPINFNTAEKYGDFYFEYNLALERGRLNFIFKLMKSIKYKKWLFPLFHYDPKDINHFLQLRYYKLRKDELITLIENYKKTVITADFDETMKKYTSESMILFKAYLAKRFNKDNSRFKPEDLKNNVAKFIARYPIIFSTSHSLKNCLCNNFIYDYLIVDEASQTDIITGALAMSCAANVVIVGDTKQLSNIITAADRPEFEKIFRGYNLLDAYNHCHYNLMSSVIKLFPKLKNEAVLLNEHYRCHPKIIGFCNNRYYNGELVSMTYDNNEKDVMAVFKTVDSSNLMRKDADGKKYNPRQADVIKEELLQKYHINTAVDSVAIVAPYRRQIKELNAKIGETCTTEIDTIHKFQGREKNIVIFSTVEDEIDNGFIDDAMVNVAVSRAVNHFFIIIPDNENNISNSNIKDLVNYIRYNNMEVVESKICSIFDLFYAQYSKRLEKYELIYRKYKKNEHIAENLIKTLLDELLEMKEFSGLSYFRHYLLVNLIKRDTLLEVDDLFNGREWQFAMNRLSHIDFLIYTNSDKRAVLAIEVDGSYHINDPKQVERDAVKESIFIKLDIPLLRISTRNSMEKRQIYNQLCAIRNIKPCQSYEEVV